MVFERVEIWGSGGGQQAAPSLLKLSISTPLTLPQAPPGPRQLPPLWLLPLLPLSSPPTFCLGLMAEKRVEMALRASAESEGGAMTTTPSLRPSISTTSCGSG